MPNAIKPADEYTHASGREKDWRESYYFNFVNHDNKTSGFTTIGVLPNQQKAEFVFALFHEDKQALYYKEHQLASNAQRPDTFSDKTLTYRLVQPLKKWEISLVNEELSLQIQWKSRFPPFDFGKGSGTSWKGHFEQSGNVRGEVQFPGGRRIQIDGYGQRDKSWGQRNWHIQNWFALHAQFQKYSIGLRRDTVNNAQRVSGGLSAGRKQYAVSKIDMEMTCEKGNNENPTGAVTTILFDDGKTATFQSRLISPRSFVKFSRTFPEGSTELFEGMAIHECRETGEKGTGLIEFLFTHSKQ